MEKLFKRLRTLAKIGKKFPDRTAKRISKETEIPKKGIKKVIEAVSEAFELVNEDETSEDDWG